MGGRLPSSSAKTARLGEACPAWRHGIEHSEYLKMAMHFRNLRLEIAAIN